MRVSTLRPIAEAMDDEQDMPFVDFGPSIGSRPSINRLPQQHNRLHQTPTRATNSHHDGITYETNHCTSSNGSLRHHYHHQLSDHPRHSAPTSSKAGSIKLMRDTIMRQDYPTTRTQPLRNRRAAWPAHLRLSLMGVALVVMLASQLGPALGRKLVVDPLVAEAQSMSPQILDANTGSALPTSSGFSYPLEVGSRAVEWPHKSPPVASGSGEVAGNHAVIQLGSRLSASGEPIVESQMMAPEVAPEVAAAAATSWPNKLEHVTQADNMIAEASKKKKKKMKMMKKKKKMEKKHKEWKKGKKHKKKKFEMKKKKGGMMKKKKGKKEKKKWGMEKKGHKKKGNFKKKKWGKKKKMKKGQKKGKKGHKKLMDKGHKKKGFKKIYHKEEWGKKKKWHDIKREKKWNTKQKKWKKKWHQEKGKKYKGKHMKKYKKMNKHGKKYKKEKKSKWKKHKGEKFKKGHKKKKEEYSKKKEGGKKKKMKKMKKEMKKKKKG